MTLPTKFPEWATDLANIVEPSSGRKESGWETSQRPPAQYFNWLHNLNGEWAKELYRISVKQAVSNWRNVPLDTNTTIYAIAGDGAGKVVVVGTGGAIQCTDDPYSGLFVDHGAAGGYVGEFYGACWDAVSGLFIIVGTNSEIQTSPDGATWTSRVTGGSVTYRAVAANSAGKIVAVGHSGEIRRSTNGTAWTVEAAPAALDLNAVCAGPGDRFVAVGDGAIYYTNNAGDTWSTATVDTMDAGEIWAVAYNVNFGRFVARSTSRFYYSDDGLTWTSFAMPGTGKGLVSLDHAVVCSGIGVFSEAQQVVLPPFDSLSVAQGVHAYPGDTIEQNGLQYFDGAIWAVGSGFVRVSGSIE